MHVPQIDRRALLIALAQAGEHTPERAQQIRWLPENRLWPELHRWQLPAATLQAAHPAVLQQRNHVFDDIAIQERVSKHLQALGLPAVSVRYLTPADLHAIPPLQGTWKVHLKQTPRWWTYPGLPHTTAAMLLFADDPAWTPLIELIEDGYWPIGLCQGQFFIHDPEAG